MDDRAAAASRGWPNLYLLGNPKSGSTFLFNCLRAGPFDPNLLHGRDSASWAGRPYLLTTLGSKKEFNFWGGPGWRWGWEWYLGPAAPMRLWEWADDEPRIMAGEPGARWGGYPRSPWRDATSRATRALRMRTTCRPAA